MKINKITRILAGVALVAGMKIPMASAGVLFTNEVQNSQAMCVGITWSDYANGVGTMGTRYDQAYVRDASPSYAWKAWIQFDMSNTWRFYGESNLQSATLTYWGLNGTSRSFGVAGLANDSGLDTNLDMNNLTWSNAPGNEVLSGRAFDTNVIYDHALLWQGNGGGG